MASINFDKASYNQGETAKITYSGVGSGSNLNILSFTGVRIASVYISGSSTYHWKTDRTVPLGKCLAQVYTPPDRQPKATAETEILPAIPITPPIQPPPEGYIDLFLECPGNITLAPGNYDLLLTCKGYQSKKVEGVTITDAQTTSISVILNKDEVPEKGFVNCKTTPSGAAIWVREV